MKKELITAANVDECICKEDGKFYLGPDKILSPGAKDELAKRRVRIVYGPMPEPVRAEEPCSCQAKPDAAGAAACCNSMDELAIAVAALIQKECKIEDPAQLRALTVEALKRLSQKC